MSILRQIWEWWKPVGQLIGDFIGRMVLSLFYFTVFAPFGLGVRLFGDPLDIRRRSEIGWIKRSSASASIDKARRLS